MATIAQDTFTDTDETDLESHTPDTGTAWVDESVWQIGFDGVLSNTLTAAHDDLRAARETTTIGDDDMDVSLDLADAWAALDAAMEIGPAGRFVDTTASNNKQNHYRAVAISDGTDIGFELFKRVSNTDTSLGTSTTDPVNGDTIQLKIITATKKLLVNTTEKISSTDDSLTGNNFAGIMQNKAAEAHPVDNYLSESVAATATPKGPLGMPLAGPFGGPI